MCGSVSVALVASATAAPCTPQDWCTHMCASHSSHVHSRKVGVNVVSLGSNDDVSVEDDFLVGANDGSLCVGLCDTFAEGIPLTDG